MKTPDRSGWRSRTQAGIDASTSAGFETRNETQRGSIDSPSRERVALGGRARRAPERPDHARPSSRSMISWLRSSWDSRLPRRRPRGRPRARERPRARDRRRSGRTARGRRRGGAPRSAASRRRGPPTAAARPGASAGSAAGSEGSSARAHSPASCMTPRPWVNRECSAVGKTQRALWSWLIRRSRWSQAVSRRSSSATSSSGRPAAAGFVAGEPLRQLDVAVDRVADEVDGGEGVARHAQR